MPDSTTYIKKIRVGELDYPINASQIDGHTWTDITDLVEAGFEFKMAWSEAKYSGNTAPSVEDLAKIPQGIKVKYNNGTSESLNPGTLVADSPIKNNIYLVCVGGGAKSVYDEYAVVGSTTAATGYQWERLGSTDVDLSNYPTKDVAGKAGTYPTSEASTVTTGSGGDGTATGTATITVPVQTVTSTSEGGVTIQGSNFGFSGSTGTITIGNNSNDHVWIDKHKYQPAGTIGGSAVVPSHGHTYSTITMVTPSKITAWSAGSLPSVTPITVVTGNGGTPSIAITELTSTSASVLTGVKASGSATVMTSLTTSGEQICKTATVDANGVLSFSSTFALNSATTNGTANVVTGVTSNGTTNALTSVDAGKTAAVLNSLATATAYMFSNTTTARGSLPSLTYEGATAINNFVLQDAPSVTINGSNFTFTGTTATLSHTVTGTPTTATADQLWVDIATRTINFTPAGSITGSQTVSGHTHNVTIGATTVVGTAAVAVSSHTHSMGHTHTATIPNCE